MIDKMVTDIILFAIFKAKLEPRNNSSRGRLYIIAERSEAYKINMQCGFVYLCVCHFLGPQGHHGQIQEKPMRGGGGGGGFGRGNSFRANSRGSWGMPTQKKKN